MSFLIASTNLVIELGLVLLVLLSWHFVLGNFLLGLLMIVYAYGLSRIWLPERLSREAREHAEHAEAEEMGGHGEVRGSWKDKLTSGGGWRAIAEAYVHE